MANVNLQPLTQWPDGAPKRLVDGTLEPVITLDDATLAVVASSGPGEVFGVVQDLAFDLGHFNQPASADELRCAWYGRAPGVDRPWMPARRTGQRPPSLLALPLASIPSGTDVFVMVSSMENGEAAGYAELPNVPLPYYNAAGVRLWTLPGESLSLPSQDYPLSAEQILRNELIMQGRKRVSRWAPARTGATAASPVIYAPDGTPILLSNRSSLLSFGSVPPRASTLRLVSVVGSIPWFRSENAADAREGLIAGDAFDTVSNNRSRLGVFAVESDPGSASAPWYVMAFRS